MDNTLSGRSNFYIGSPVTYIGADREAWHVVIREGMRGTIVSFADGYPVVQFYNEFDFLCKLSDLKYESK